MLAAVPRPCPSPSVCGGPAAGRQLPGVCPGAGRGEGHPFGCGSGISKEHAQTDLGTRQRDAGLCLGLGQYGPGQSFLSPPSQLPRPGMDGWWLPKCPSIPLVDAAVPSTPSLTCRQRCPVLPSPGSAGGQRLGGCGGSGMGSPLPTLGHPSHSSLLVPFPMGEWVTPVADGGGAGAGMATARGAERGRGPSSLLGPPAAAHQAERLLHRLDVLSHARLRRLHAADLLEGLGAGGGGG